MQKDQIARILKRLEIDELNDMQQKALNAILNKTDILLTSPTGTGKTLAFLLPISQCLTNEKKGIQCLIIVPSRELGLQIEHVWKKMATGHKVNVFYGGHKIETELNSLKELPTLLIGTPGRLADHLQRGSFETTSITTLVLDEFDKSLELGFEEQMTGILDKLPHLKKRILVSATRAIEIPEFTKVKEPEILDFLKQDTNSSVKYKTVISDEKDKINTLIHLLCFIGIKQAIVFCNHREAVERISKNLSQNGIDNVLFHGGLEQMEREQALSLFRNGSAYFMVATDLAARGLDIPDVRHVIHYHLAGTNEEFIHRNGRTGRMKASGTVWLILHREEPKPEYITDTPEIKILPAQSKLPPKPQWTTVYINGGKKDKVSKGDIVGFFSKVGELAKDDLGMIEVKDHISFAAVKRSKTKNLLERVRQEKMKGVKYRIAIAR